VPAGETVINNCPALNTTTTTTTTTTTAPAMSGTPAAVPSVSMMATPGTTGAAVTAPATGAANACPTLSLANPGPGDLLPPGGLFISGTASVAGSTSGSGVQRVDLFLGERDQGGTFLGSGIPGTAPGGNPDAFSVQVTVPNLERGLDFAAYAIGVNGQEQVTTFPVFVGAEPTRTAVGPTPTPVPQTITVTSTCK
jgi:hypothetical protein